MAEGGGFLGLGLGIGVDCMVCCSYEALTVSRWECDRYVDCAGAMGYGI